MPTTMTAPAPTSTPAPAPAAGAPSARIGGGFEFSSGDTGGGWSGAIVNLRRSPPETFLFAELCPEIGQSETSFEASEKLARYNGLLDEIRNADQGLAEFRRKAADAEVAAVEALTTGPGDVMSEVAADAAMGDLSDMKSHRSRLVRAARQLYAELTEEWKSTRNVSRRRLLEESIAKQKQLKGEIAAVLQPLLDTLNRETARFQKLNGGLIASDTTDLIVAPPRE